MRRLVSAPLDHFERLFLDASGAADIERASYPPACDPPTGPLRFRPLQVGGLKLEVERRELDSDDFRLSTLFYSGSCVFTDALDLAGFFRGAVARAFDLAVEPLPDRPTESLLEDLRPRPVVSERPARQPSRRKASRPGVVLSASELERRLGLEIRGQGEAVRRIAEVVCGHLVKLAPARPESLMLIGPSGSGKTSSIEALPEALADLGCPNAHVFRVDCNELTDDYDARRFLGAAPGLVGYRDEPPLFQALAKGRCIVLLDEIEKAHEEVRTVFLGLLDEGRITAPDGTAIRAPDAIVAMTTNLGVEELGGELLAVPAHDRWRQRVCRRHLLRMGWPAELVGRIGGYAIFERISQEAIRQVAEDAIQALGREYGFEIEALPPLLADVVLDLADDRELGARALRYAARELLGRPFAQAALQGLSGRASLDAGPPPRVVVGLDQRLA